MHIYTKKFPYYSIHEFQLYLHTNVHVKIGKASNTDFKLESHDESEIMVLISCDYIRGFELDVENCGVAYVLLRVYVLSIRISRPINRKCISILIYSLCRLSIFTL